ncbi:MAG: ATP-binding protein [Planctomycetes bacterium]|nr:ATP-binding protein [Planctomycetota bacterium]
MANLDLADVARIADDFQRREYSARRRHHERLLATSPDTLVRNDEAVIGRLVAAPEHIEERGRRVHYILNAVSLSGRFRDGDRVWLFRPEEYPAAIQGARANSPTEFEVVRREFADDGSTRLYLSGGARLALPEREYLLLESVRDPFLGAADDLHAGPSTQPSESPWNLAIPTSVVEPLNEDQRDALSALSGRGWDAIQGPPGTGKTEILAAIACGAILAGKRVGLCTLSHRALVNAFERCARLWTDVLGRSIGELFIATKPWHYAGIDAEQKLKEAPDGARLVAAVSAAWLTSHQPPQVDLMIVDEASQIDPTHSVRLLSRWPAGIAIGDDKQLGPISVDSADVPSLFEVVRREGSPVLRLQYRMHPNIQEYPSQRYYGGALRSAESTNGHLPRLGTERRLLDGNHRQLLRLASDDSNYVDVEAAIAATIVEEAIRTHGYQPDQLAVISPHRATNNRVLRAVASRMGGRFAQDVLCDTVERLQGREKELIVMAWGFEKFDSVPDRNFLDNPRRLNVALTRARSKIVVLSSNPLARQAQESGRRGGEILSYLLYLSRAVSPVPVSA